MPSCSTPAHTGKIAEITRHDRPSAGVVRDQSTDHGQNEGPPLELGWIPEHGVRLRYREDHSASCQKGCLVLCSPELTYDKGDGNEPSSPLKSIAIAHGSARRGSGVRRPYFARGNSTRAGPLVTRLFRVFPCAGSVVSMLPLAGSALVSVWWSKAVHRASRRLGVQRRVRNRCG